MNGPVPVDAARLRQMPLPQPEGDKESRGAVLVVGGSRDVPGAALLAGLGALRAGAGKLQVATVRSVAAALALALPEALVAGLPETEGGGIDAAAADDVVRRAERVDALLVGPGMDDKEALVPLMDRLLGALEPGRPILVDAEAFVALGQRPDLLRRHAGATIVTPHAGEMAAFLGIHKDAVLADPVTAARRAAERTGGVVVMKGACTFIVGPSGAEFSCSHGHVGLATSGSGDTLAGIMAGLLARGMPPEAAAQWAVFLHAEAGRRLADSVGPIGFLAREIPGIVPRLMGELAA